MAAQGGDGAGSVDGPSHAGLLEALADDSLAARLDHAGAYEQAAGAEPLVAHARGVSLEVAEGRVELVFLAPQERVDAGGGADAVNVAWSRSSRRAASQSSR